MGLIIKEILHIGETALAQAGCMNPRIDAELLLRHLLSIDRTQLFIRYPSILGDKACEEYFKLIDIRAGGKPLQYMTGQQEFMGITFMVNEAVLIPRQDTETLVEEVIGYTKSRKGGCQILDLCCGSGAIGISLCKHLKNAKVTMSDISEKALEVARYNAKETGVSDRMKLVKSDLFGSFKKGFGSKKYDIIVSNPPYIESHVIPTLQREVAEHEPMLALDGGEDGLDFYRHIVAEAPAYLKKNGMLFLEIGHDQGRALLDIIGAAGGYGDVEVIKDLAGLDRVVKCQIL